MKKCKALKKIVMKKKKALKKNVKLINKMELDTSMKVFLLDAIYDPFVAEDPREILIPQIEKGLIIS